MKTNEIQAVWTSNLDHLLQLKGDLLGIGRAVKPDELANEIGVSRQTVYQWRDGDGLKSLTADHAARLEHYFGVSVWRIWELQIVGQEESEPGQFVPAAV